MNKSVLNQNMTILINECFNAGIGVGGKAPRIDNLLNITYNSFNDTLYIETEDKYIVVECKGGIMPLMTEFPKTTEQKIFNGGVPL